MRSLVHNRVELIEAYAEARQPLDAANLDALFTTLCEVAVKRARDHFGGNIEVIVQLDRREGSGAGPAIRTTILTDKVAAWFPRHRSLSETAGHIARIGKLFARDVAGHLAAALGTPGKPFVRQEVRRKAPGKVLDLLDRIAPAEMLKVERVADLAAREREWLADDIANLRRAVHGDVHFTRLMSQLKREANVAFLPTTTADLKTLSRKLVGVPTGEARLHRRRRCPAFADPKRAAPLCILAMKCTLNRRGAVQGASYHSD
ncbi:MAG: hypothetical protein SFV19_10990 [Rhodospirillaceae bacterium]|nr:hypothetical protein [Rhodospirillaceae bacterium]